MDAKRLEFVGRFLFEEQGPWRRELARYLDVHETTVMRWQARDRVPTVATLALEQSFQHGLYRKPEAIHA